MIEALSIIYCNWRPEVSACLIITKEYASIQPCLINPTYFYKRNTSLLVLYLVYASDNNIVTSC